jgi:hypothetical protein
MSTLHIAEMGMTAPALPIFAVKNKRPLEAGWQDSPPISLDAVTSWEPRHTGCGWAAAVVNDLFIIDCDSDAALSTLSDNLESRPIPCTRVTLTPRGFHLWFRKPEDVVVRNRVAVKPGIDVRSKGGYVVIPPSDGYAFANESAPIADAPEWILQLVTGDNIKDNIKASTNADTNGNNEPELVEELSPFDKDIATRRWEKRQRVAPGKVPDGRSPLALRILYEPQNVVEGMRNAALYAYCCRLRREGKNEESIRSEAWQAVARIPEPLSKFEVDRIIANVMKQETRAIGHNTLTQAWRTVERIETTPGTTKFYRFLLLVEQLIDMRPETKPTILLPLKAIGTLMGSHFTQVRRWRMKAEKTGILTKVSGYVSRRLADEFTVKADFSPLTDGPAQYKARPGRKKKKEVPSN